jgi:hypothetical protein
MSTLKVSTLQNLSGTEVYTCKAWVNFNGTGTVAIRGSGNVTSITDNGTGNYTVNFTAAMADENYSAIASGGLDGGEIVVSVSRQANPPTTTTTRLECRRNNSDTDSAYVSFSVFR